MIKSLTRGTVVFEFEGKTATLQGEGYLRGHGSPDWVIYANSLVGWDVPHQREVLDDDVKTRLLAALLAAFRARGMTAVVE
jgi:hypothetical protein